MHSNANARRYQQESVVRRSSLENLLQWKVRNVPLPKRHLRLKKLAQKVPLLRPLRSSQSKSKRRCRNHRPSIMLFQLFQLSQSPMPHLLLPQPVSSMVRCHRPPFDPRAAAHIPPANHQSAATRSPHLLLCLQHRSAPILWPTRSYPKSSLRHTLTSTSRSL